MIGSGSVKQPGHLLDQIFSTAEFGIEFKYASRIFLSHCHKTNNGMRIVYFDNKFNQPVVASLQLSASSASSQFFNYTLISTFLTSSSLCFRTSYGSRYNWGQVIPDIVTTLQRLEHSHECV